MNASMHTWGNFDGYTGIPAWFVVVVRNLVPNLSTAVDDIKAT